MVMSRGSSTWLRGERAKRALCDRRECQATTNPLLNLNLNLNPNHSCSRASLKMRLAPSSLGAETNVMMRQIDLGCKVMAPVMAGVVMSYGNISEAALCVGLFNCLAIVVEFICTKKVYDSVGALAEAREVREAGAGKAKAGSFLHSLQAFFSQNVWGAGVALSLLYLNVLSFGR